MRVVRANLIGFCFGVRRAAGLVQDLLDEGRSPVYTLGPLMHNPQEVERLAALGVEVRERIEDCRGATTLVRTHGIAREEVEKARELQVKLVDATCPRVEVPRRHVERFGLQGRHVLLVGDHGHPEVRAMASWAVGPITVVAGPGEVPDLPAETSVAVVAQTTQSPEAFRRVVETARSRFPDTRHVDTVCEDAGRRQAEGRELAAKADAVVVVGGRNSANTRRLAAICARVQPRTHHVESADEAGAIDRAGVEEVVLISGASTPDWIIDAVEARLKKPLKSH
jgi:4-hydroxy-3-methylbut-2-enyl diphosphate reductase